MTTQQVADRYYELAQQNKWNIIIEELYSPDVVNREPEHAIAMGIPTLTTGLPAVLAKSAARRTLIQEVHTQYCTEPVVRGNFFCTAMGRDMTFKDGRRVQPEELAIFEVKDGKIVLEQFFY